MGGRGTGRPASKGFRRPAAGCCRRGTVSCGVRVGVVGTWGGCEVGGEVVDGVFCAPEGGLHMGGVGDLGPGDLAAADAVVGEQLFRDADRDDFVVAAVVEVDRHGRLVVTVLLPQQDRLPQPVVPRIRPVV